MNPLNHTRVKYLHVLALMMPGKKGRPPSGKSKQKLQLYLPEDLYNRIQDLAKEGYRSLTDQVRMMIDIALKKMDEEKKR